MFSLGQDSGCSILTSTDIFMIYFEEHVGFTGYYENPERKLTPPAICSTFQ